MAFPGLSPCRGASQAHCEEQTLFTHETKYVNAFKYLRARLGAVHDSVAAVKGEGVLKFGQTFLCEFITGVNHPPVCLQVTNRCHS